MKFCNLTYKVGRFQNNFLLKLQSDAEYAGETRTSKKKTASKEDSQAHSGKHNFMRLVMGHHWEE